MNTSLHLSYVELMAGLPQIIASPVDAGRLAMIVARPGRGERQILSAGSLDLEQGLVGDNWKARIESSLAGGADVTVNQLTLMNMRALALIARSEERWPLAGDQLIVDMNLGAENLPPGTRLQIGTALLEVTAEPHTGCRKFAERYGVDAVKFVNSPDGKRHHLRGINARVITPGKVQVGDLVHKISV